MGEILNVRIATLNDLAAITAIYNEAIEKTVATFDTELKTVDDRLGWFAQHSNRVPIWVCEIDGKIVGWACISLWSDRRAYAGTIENSVYILEKHQGKGVGRTLMEVLMDHVRKNNFKTVLARISDGNRASIALHEKFGFETIGTMKSVGYKFDRWIDVKMMQIILDPTSNDGSESF